MHISLYKGDYRGDKGKKMPKLANIIMCVIEIKVKWAEEKMWHTM